MQISIKTKTRKKPGAMHFAHETLLRVRKSFIFSYPYVNVNTSSCYYIETFA